MVVCGVWLISNCFPDEMMVYMEFTVHSIRAKYHRKSNGFPAFIVDIPV